MKSAFYYKQIFPKLHSRIFPIISISFTSHLSADNITSALWEWEGKYYRSEIGVDAGEATKWQGGGAMAFITVPGCDCVCMLCKFTLHRSSAQTLVRTLKWTSLCSFLPFFNELLSDFLLHLPPLHPHHNTVDHWISDKETACFYDLNKRTWSETNSKQIHFQICSVSIFIMDKWFCHIKITTSSLKSESEVLHGRFKSSQLRKILLPVRS